MRCLSTNGEGGVVFNDVDEPIPAANELVIEVSHSSLNRGDLLMIKSGQAGHLRGLDAVGVVTRAADDGSGAPVGTRVLAYPRFGGWSERIAVSTEKVVPLPDAVSSSDAAVLPAAGLTALRALHYGGFLLGVPVLVTGATGGVGCYAVQLARESGAHVTAVVSSPDRQEFIDKLGGIGVVVGDKFDGPYDLILDGVGGKGLNRSFDVISDRGTIVIYGEADRTPIQVPSEWWYKKPGARMVGMVVIDELARHNAWNSDLRLLVSLVENGRLDPLVSGTYPWTHIEEALAAMQDRQVMGKIAISVGGE